MSVISYAQPPKIGDAGRSPLLRNRIWIWRSFMSDQRITMDSIEMKLIDKYEEKFGCVPPVAFLDPKTSKKMIRESLVSNRAFSEADFNEDWE